MGNLLNNQEQDAASIETVETEDTTAYPTYWVEAKASTVNIQEAFSTFRAAMVAEAVWPDSPAELSAYMEAMNDMNESFRVFLAKVTAARLAKL